MYVNDLLIYIYIVQIYISVVYIIVDILTYINHRFIKTYLHSIRYC